MLNKPGNDAETWTRQNIRKRKGKRQRQDTRQDRPAVFVHDESRSLDVSNGEGSGLNNQGYVHPRPHIRNAPLGVNAQTLLTENEKYIKPENLADEHLACWFMTKGDQETRRVYQTEPVRNFCFNPAEYQQLRSRAPGIPSKKICLIDDRTNNGTTSKALEKFTPLRVQEMYLKLMEDRFHSPSTPGSPDKPNANRRLTFITDPNSYAVTALMATASSSQVDVLRDFLYSYIAFKSDIGMFSESCGFSNSSLYFHLPFYSWRETHQEPRDLRLKEDGRPLRCVQDMSFLKAESQETSFKKDYLCEAQVSVLIVTIDDTVWTGYCFVDTYYQPQGERKCVDDYYEDGMQTDPFTQGDANKPILSPTEYFLASLHYQLKVFRDEWMNTAYNFKKRVESYIKGFDYTLAESSVLTNRETQASLAWLFDTQDQLNMLIMSLETSIACWDNFTPQDHFPTIPITQPLKAIQQIFIEMRNCLIVLKNIRTLYDSHEKALSLNNIHAQNHLSSIQTKVARNNQTLSYFLLYVVSPITLAAAILSMQEKAIPSFLGPNKLSFVVLTPVLTMLVFGVAKTIESWEKIQQFLNRQPEAVREHGSEFV